MSRDSVTDAWDHADKCLGITSARSVHLRGQSSVSSQQWRFSSCRAGFIPLPPVPR